MTRTFLFLRVYIEGTGALNAPNLKRQDGTLLAKVLVREIATPPVACLGMFIKVKGDDEQYEVKDLTWLPDIDALTLAVSRGIIYRDQGPEDLAGRNRVVAFFDGFVGEMILAGGWHGSESGKAIREFLEGAS